MSDVSFRNSYNEQLTRIYVALAMVQDATRRWVNEKPEYGPLKGLVTTLEVTARMLEEILEQTLPEEPEKDSEAQPSAELVM